MHFDLEKLLLSVLNHTEDGVVGGAGDGEDEEEEDGRNFGNSSLRRKLFGQPERQVGG